jgi:5-methylcytosine-specific restriction endonuclease McrA
MDIRHISDEELLADIGKLVGSERKLTAELVRCLAEIEERRLHLHAGFSSMFEFCLKELGFSEGEAFRRLLAARLGRRFPVVYSLLASGAVHLSALELAREWLTEENHAELLEAISRKTTREVEALLAERFPGPDVPSRIRRVGRIEPLSKHRYKVEFTASAELCEKLELCRDLLSHAEPSRDLAAVVERAVDLLLADLQKKRLARTKRPRRDGVAPAKQPDRKNAPGGETTPSGETTSGRVASRLPSRRVSNPTRRHVFERDGLRCTYVSPGGRRCGARAFLELDHAHPRGAGGSDEPENLRVRCRAHNQLWAEQAYGREHIERQRHFRQRKWSAPGARRENGAPSDPAPSDAGQPEATLDKVRRALRGLGFRDSEALRAVEAVARKHAEPPSVEQALREALLVATTAVTACAAPVV